MWTAALLMFTLAAFNTLPATAAPSTIAGSWHAVIDTNTGPTVVTITIGGEDGALTGSETSPETMAFDTVTVKGAAVHITAKDADMTFDGTLQEGGNTIAGTMMLSGQPMPVTLAKGADPVQLTDAQAARVAGIWEGMLDKLGLLVDLHIAKDITGLYIATVDSVFQRASGIPASFVTAGHMFSLKIPLVGAKFAGMIKSADQITGTFSQSGLDMPLTLHKVDRATTLDIALTDETATKFAGIWEGMLGQSGLQLDLHIDKGQSGLYSATVDSPFQGQSGIPAVLAIDGDKIDLKQPQLGASFHGLIHDDLKLIDGTFTQLGLEQSLVLSKVTKVTPASRPQTPQPTGKYHSDDITFPGGTKGTVLAGTITVPTGKGPFPAVVLVSGSGRNDRDETIFGHKPFLVLADTLSKRGIAVLRYDKRGTHKSTGDYASATTADFAADASAGVRYLKSRKEISAAHIGIIGHSEGGLIAPICAVQSKDVSFIVLLAAPGTRGDKLLTWQTEAMGKASGESDAVIAQGKDLIRAATQIYARESNVKRAESEIRAHAQKYCAQSSADGSAGVYSSQVTVFVNELCTPWLRSFLLYDPVPTLRKVKCPVLALSGSLDKQVSPTHDLPAIAAALKAARNRDATCEVFPGLNHLFQPAKTGSSDEYGKIETTIAPSALAKIGDWVVGHCEGGEIL